MTPHTHVYVVKEYYNHTQPLPLTPSYWAGWVAVLTKSRLNGHLRWIIVCEWKLGQIISMLLAQGWVRPLSPFLHTHTHSSCFTIPISTSHLFADSLPFTISPSLSCPSVSFAPFFSSFSTTCVFSPLSFFSQQLWPLSCRPFTSLWLPSPVPAVNSGASWKHKHAQAWDEQLSRDRPLLTATATTTSLSAPFLTRGLCASDCFTSELLSEVYLHHRCNSCLSSCQSALCEC